MAKKKSEEVIAAPDDFNERLMADVDATYGEGLILGGEDVANQVKTVIPSCPSIDIITSGGFKEGSWVSIGGPEKYGKTVLALTIAANAQKPEYGSRVIYYLAIESRVNTEHWKGIKGLNLDRKKFKIIQSKEGQILTSQMWLDIAMRIIRTVPNAIIIMDSLSTLCEERVMNEGIGTQTRGGGNMWLSQFIDMMAPVVPVNNIIVIGITRQIANTGNPMGPRKVDKVANAWKYQSDYKLTAIINRPWKVGEKQIGQFVTWKCGCSKLGPPGMLIESYLRYGVGYDKLYESLTFGQTVQLIKKSGAWLSLDYLGTEQYKHLLVEGVIPKCQGSEQAYQLLLANPAWAEALEKEVMRAAGSLAGGGGDD